MGWVKKVTYQDISQDPELSNLRRVLFKDGIEYSISMANLSYSRLRADLLALSQNDYSWRKENKETLSKGQVNNYKISALTNAWQIIDSVNRLRELLRQAPGIKHDT